MRAFPVLALPLLLLLVGACSGASPTELYSELHSEPAEAGATTTLPTKVNAPPDAGARPEPDRDAGLIEAASPDAGGDPCKRDNQCTSGAVCNWKTDRCATPGPLGAPCKRDLECTEMLCNWELETCTAPAPAGVPCRRNKECASGKCDDTCS